MLGGLDAGGSEKCGISTGIPNLLFCLLFALKCRQFLPECGRYSNTTKENHHKEDT